MLNIYYIFIIIINITLITFIFWLITMLEVYFNKNTQHETKTNIYECGFLTVGKNIFPVTLNLILLLFFVIIYEVEFVLIVPLFITFIQISNHTIFIICSLFYIITLTLYFDIWLNKINWIY